MFYHALFPDIIGNQCILNEGKEAINKEREKKREKERRKEAIEKEEREKEKKASQAETWWGKGHMGGWNRKQNFLVTFTLMLALYT